MPSQTNPPKPGPARENAAVDSPQKIFRVENHDEALAVWRNAECSNRVLVHVDAHHDLWWLPPDGVLTIANFIAPALRDALLREIYWVVPDGSWESAGNRRRILRHLSLIQKGFPGPKAKLEIHHDRLSTTLLGKPLHVMSAGTLPKFGEEVLLDLDVDYLLLPRVTGGLDDSHPRLPWIWPEELVSRLRAREVRSDLVTIAYSVTGGYTPLQWKYLGDELELRLRGSNSQAIGGMDRMREGAECAALGEYAAAERKYIEAAEALPKLAAPLWHLAFLYLDWKQSGDAMRKYEAALQRDPLYSTPFKNNALWEYWREDHDAAEHESRRLLSLDSADPYAHLILGWLAAERSEWGEAESELHKALDAKPDLLDAHRALGRVYRQFSKRKEAISAYNQSLKLALLGHEPLRHIGGISSDRIPWNDNSHFAVYRRLGRLYFDEGDFTRAVQHLRMAAAGGMDDPSLRFLLARIAFQQRNFAVFGTELALVLRQCAVLAAMAMKRAGRALWKPFRRTMELWRVR